MKVVHSWKILKIDAINLTIENDEKNDNVSMRTISNLVPNRCVSFVF